MFHFVAILVQVTAIIAQPDFTQNALFSNKTSQKTTLFRQGRKKISIRFFGISLCDLEPVGVSEHVAIARDESTDLTGDRVIAVTFGVSDVSSVDVDAERWLEADIVDSMDARVAENGDVSFPIDALAYLFNPRHLRVRTVVSATVECFSLLPIVDPNKGPGKVVMDGSGLAGMPDAADNREGLV